MKKTLFLLMAVLYAGSAFAQTNAPFHGIQIVDERGEVVTTITSVEIYAPDTTSNAVIFADRGLRDTITIPMTESSTNTTLVDGVFHWYGPDGYDFSITDGTNIITNANHRTRTATEGTIWFPSFLTNLSTTQYLDAESITFGTSSDWQVNGGNVANLLQWTPVADNSSYDIGLSGTALNSDFNVWVGTALGLKLDAGVPSLVWDGGAATLNHNSNFNVGLCTGTSTGAITIGSSTAGVITIDSTSTGTINTDGALSITTSDAGADITINSVLGRVIIEGEEDAAQAVLITADGDTASTVRIHNDTGTSATSIDLLSDVGGITATASAGLVNLTATGASAGDITLSAGDIMTFTSVDTKIFDGATAETWIVEGTADASEATVSFTDPTADIQWTFPTGATDEFAVMGSTLVTNVAEAANSVWGGTNQLIFEGATTNDFETFLASTDATADATLTLPDDTGSIGYTPTGKTTKDATDAALALTHAIIEGTSDADSEWSLANGENGQVLTVVIVTDGGEAVVTPATATGWVTAVLTDDIDTLTVMYIDDTVGWIVLGTGSDGTNLVALTQ